MNQLLVWKTENMWNFSAGTPDERFETKKSQIDENVQKAVLCPTNFNLSQNKERSHNLNSHTGGNWPQRSS